MRVRQFVADASHELRTPLASIRGYAEFAQPRAGPLPPDVAHALERVESRDRADDRARRRPAAARPARRRPPARRRARRPHPARRRRRQRRPRRRPRPRLAARPARRAVESPATTPGCIRSSATCSPTRARTRPPGTTVTVRPSAPARTRRPRGRRPHGGRRRAGHPARAAPDVFERFARARPPGPATPPAPAPGSGSPSSRPSSRRTAARSTSAAGRAPPSSR